MGKYFTTARDGYMGGIETIGSIYASGKRLYGAELSKAIRAALKENGIKGCTVACHTFAGGQSVRVKMPASTSDFIAREDFGDDEFYDMIIRWACEDGVPLCSCGRHMLTAAYIEKIDAVQRILDAFNHDDSNSMVDYFDRHFYDSIVIKAS